MEADLERLRQINRAMRHLSELVYKDPEYEALYSDLKLLIYRNEERIFQILTPESYGWRIHQDLQENI
jgi:hypothetical protein